MATGARTAVRIRPEQRSRFDRDPEGEGEKIFLSGLVVLPRQFYEEGKGWVTIEGRDVYVLASSRVQETEDGPKRAYRVDDVKADDQLELDGELWEVEGPPADYEKGRTRKASLVRIKRIGAS